MRKHSVVFLLLLLLGALSLVLGVHSQHYHYDWPTYRHDVRGTGYTLSSAPVAGRVQWNVTTGSPICSSAAIVDGRLYIGSGCSILRNVLCLDANTGAVIWSQTVGGYLCSSPAVECGRVYIGTNWCSGTGVCDAVGGIYCLDANTGDILWDHIIGDTQVYSSPAVVDGKVFIGSSDNNTYCFDASTGNLIWNYTTEGSVCSSPAVSNGKVYIGSDDSNLYCLGANTGNVVWNKHLSPENKKGTIWSSPAVVDGKVIVGTRNWLFPHFDYPGSVYCLDVDTGDQIWNYTTDGSIMSSPAVAYGKVYIGTESPDGSVYCLDADTGDQIWNYTTGGDIHHSSPAVGGGKVYIGSWGLGYPPERTPGNIHCLDADTGDLIWNYTTAPDGYQSSSPVIAYGMVFIGGDYSVVAFNASTVVSCAADGTETDTFLPTEKVYVRGSVLPASTDVTIYIVSDGEDALPGNAVASATCTTEADGSLPTTPVWSPPLTVGQYDIWVDANQNGAYDGGDVWNDANILIYAFSVVPEPAVIVSALLMFGALGSLYFVRKLKLRSN